MRYRWFKYQKYIYILKIITIIYDICQISHCFWPEMFTLRFSEQALCIAQKKMLLEPLKALTLSLHGTVVINRMTRTKRVGSHDVIKTLWLLTDLQIDTLTLNKMSCYIVRYMKRS